MKITQIVNTLNNSDGGPARNSFELNMGLSNRSNAALVSIRGSKDDSVVNGHDETDRPLPVPGPQWLAGRTVRSSRQISTRSLVARIRESDVVIIHGYFLAWVPLVVLACKIFRTPYVLTPHGSLTARQRSFSTSRKRLFEIAAGRWVRRSLSAFVVGSEAEASDILDVWPLARVRVGGVGTRIPAVQPPASSWHSPIRLLSMSRIAPKKRIDLMIGSVAVLKDAGLNCVLTVAGSGDERLLTQLKDLSRQLGTSTCVDFKGEVSGAEKEALLQAADIFLLPSDDENFGIGLAEALAHGLPSVVSDKVAASSAMKGMGGVVLSQPTPATIAAAVTNLRKHADWASVQLEAYVVARDEFGWNRVVDRWESILTEVRGV